MKVVQKAAGGLVLAFGLAGSAGAADLTPVYGAGAVIGPSVAVPLAAPPVMYSPIRSRSYRPIQTHIIAQPAPDPRAIGEGPVMGTAYPIIIVVKP